MPRAIRLPTGEVLIGWVDGSGNIECALFDEETATLGTIRTIHASFHVDAHDSPAFVRRASDGRLLALYSLHNSVPFNIRISTNPDDPSAWGSATNLDSQLGGTGYTDYGFWEIGSTLRAIYRDEPVPGTDSRWCVSSCASSSPTTGWAAQTILYRIAGERSYVTTFLDAARGRIHFVATNGGATGGGYTGFTALFHWYWEAGVYRKSDGTSMGSPPFDFTDATEAYVGTESVFMENIAVDEDGYPIFCAIDVIAGNPSVVYRRWNGSAWQGSVVADVGTGYSYNFGFDPQAYGDCVDVSDPDALWVIREVAGNSELWRYRTSDGGLTFSGLPVTSGSSDLQITPFPVHGGSDVLRVLWSIGSWTHYDNWSMGLRGAGLT